MKLSQENWAKFGRWMMIVGGVTSICLALYRKEDVISWLLRIWVISFGLYCIYIAFAKWIILVLSPCFCCKYDDLCSIFRPQIRHTPRPIPQNKKGKNNRSFTKHIWILLLHINNPTNWNNSKQRSRSTIPGCGRGHWMLRKQFYQTPFEYPTRAICFLHWPNRFHPRLIIILHLTFQTTFGNIFIWPSISNDLTSQR